MSTIDDANTVQGTIPGAVVARFVEVTRRYRRGSETVSAVDQVSFELRAGSMVALIGPSGSGKTTLLNLLVGGDVADSGRIERPGPTGWSSVAIVPQALGLLPELTMVENIELPARLGAPVADDAASLMARLSIGRLANRPPSETSLGEQQRAAVARALLAGPTLLVADEPTSHQDEANAKRVTDALSDAADAGSCVFIATHDSRMLDRCDVVFEIRDGNVSPKTTEPGRLH